MGPCTAVGKKTFASRNRWGQPRRAAAPIEQVCPAAEPHDVGREDDELAHAEAEAADPVDPPDRRDDERHEQDERCGRPQGRRRQLDRGPIDQHERDQRERHRQRGEHEERGEARSEEHHLAATLVLHPPRDGPGDEGQHDARDRPVREQERQQVAATGRGVGHQRLQHAEAPP